MHNPSSSIRSLAAVLAFTLGLFWAVTANAAPPILVLNSLNANVSVIDPVTYKEIKRVPVGKEPHHLYLTPDNKSVMVANAEGDSITFLDPNTGEVQRTLKNILDPYHLRFSPDMKWFVTAANRLNHVDIYRWEMKNGEFQMHLVKRLPAGKTPSHIAIDSKARPRISPCKTATNSWRLIWPRKNHSGRFQQERRQRICILPPMIRRC